MPLTAAQRKRQWDANAERREFPGQQKIELAVELHLLAECHDTDVLEALQQRAQRQHADNCDQARLVVEQAHRPRHKQHSACHACENVEGPRRVVVVAGCAVTAYQRDVNAESAEQFEQRDERRSHGYEAEILRHQQPRQNERAEQS